MAVAITSLLTEASANPNTSYSTVDEAAIQALAYIQTLPKSDNTEYIGLIYEVDDLFYFTEPKGQSRRAKAKGTFAIPKGSARGIFHNHPEHGVYDQGSSSKRHFFSPGDIDMARKTGLVSYIDVGDPLAIKKFDPADEPYVILERVGARRMHHSKGRDVLLEKDEEIQLAMAD